MDDSLHVCSPAGDEALRQLKRIFGYDSFRVGQREVIDLLMRGGPVLAVMPTGAGKSLCFQLPAALSVGTALVVSPLIALMKDQVDELDRLRIPSTFINSSISYDEQRERLLAMKAGHYRLVYVAPERFRSPSFCRALEMAPIHTVAIDEAHCISEWGHDFRPDYLRLKDVLDSVRPKSIIALTATATPLVQTDILGHLGFPEAPRIITGFDRPNLRFAVRRFANESEKNPLLRQFLREHDGPGIIYTGTRKLTEQVRDFVFSLGIKAEAYHAGLNDSVKTESQNRFMANDVRVMVATSAFGMGIDKRDLRWVFHYTMRESPEAYYQEAGRAGRDGNAADCFMCSSPADFRLQRFFIDMAFPNYEIIQAVYETLIAAEVNPVRDSAEELASQATKRHAKRISWGEVLSAIRIMEQSQIVERIDRASGAWATVVSSVTAEEIGITLKSNQEQRVLSGLRDVAGLADPGVYRFSLESLSRRTGMETNLLGRMLGYMAAPGTFDYHPPASIEGVRILSEPQPFHKLPIDWDSVHKQRQAKVDKLRMIGNYVDYLGCRRAWITRYFGQMSARLDGCTCDKCSGYTISIPKSADSAAFDLPKPMKFDPPTVKVEKPKAPKKTETSVTSAVNGDLFERLRALRMELAKKRRTKPFKIFPDTVLRSLIEVRPSTVEELLDINGIGPVKAAKWGKAFLDEIQSWRD